MSVERKIMAAVARADLIVCWTVRVLAVVVLAALLLLLVWCVRTWIERECDPCLIDYDAPGVDITSEGPDDGDPWYLEGGE